MKKTVSLILALLMMLGMCIPAAAVTMTADGTQDAAVTATYVPGAAGGTVISVDVVWEDMAFTFHAEQQPVWNPETYSSSNYVSAYWEGKGKINVSNHSNTMACVTLDYAPIEGYENVKMTFGGAAAILESAEKEHKAQTVSMTVTPFGTLPALSEEGTQIGTVKVKLVTSTEVKDKQTNEDNNAAEQTVLATVKSKLDGNYASELTESEKEILRPEYDKAEELMIMVANAMRAANQGSDEYSDMELTMMVDALSAAVNHLRKYVK